MVAMAKFPKLTLVQQVEMCFAGVKNYPKMLLKILLTELQTSTQVLLDYGKKLMFLR